MEGLYGGVCVGGLDGDGVWEGCMVVYVCGRVVWWWCVWEGCMVMLYVGGLYGDSVWEGCMVVVVCGRVVW